MDSELLIDYVTEARNVRFLESPAEFYGTICEMFKKAKHRIVVSCLYLGSGSMEKVLIDCILSALEKSHLLNVDMIFDRNRSIRNIGSSNALDLLGPLFKYENVKISLFHNPMCDPFLNKVFKSPLVEIFGTLHLKIIAVDESCMITGANLSKIYFTNRLDRYMLIKDAYLVDIMHTIVATLQTLSFSLNKNRSITWNSGIIVSPLVDSTLFKRQFHLRFTTMLKICKEIVDERVNKVLSCRSKQSITGIIKSVEPPENAIDQFSSTPVERRKNSLFSTGKTIEKTEKLNEGGSFKDWKNKGNKISVFTDTDDLIQDSISTSQTGSNHKINGNLNSPHSVDTPLTSLVLPEITSDKTSISDDFDTVSGSTGDRKYLQEDDDILSPILGQNDMSDITEHYNRDDKLFGSSYNENEWNDENTVTTHLLSLNSPKSRTPIFNSVLVDPFKLDSTPTQSEPLPLLPVSELFCSTCKGNYIEGYVRLKFLFQMAFAIPAIDLEERVFKDLILKYRRSGHYVLLTTPYLNVTKECFNLYESISGGLDNVEEPALKIITCSTKSNGFFNGGGILKLIPYIYAFYALKYVETIKRSYKNIGMVINRLYKIYLEYSRPNHTFHCKGLWMLPQQLPDVEGLNLSNFCKGFKNPCAMLIGSSNMGYRSHRRDLEMTILVETGSPQVLDAMKVEIYNIAKYTSKVTYDEQYNYYDIKRSFLSYLTHQYL